MENLEAKRDEICKDDDKFFIFLVGISFDFAVFFDFNVLVKDQVSSLSIFWNVKAFYRGRFRSPGYYQ